MPIHTYDFVPVLPVNVSRPYFRQGHRACAKHLVSGDETSIDYDSRMQLLLGFPDCSLVYIWTFISHGTSIQTSKEHDSKPLPRQHLRMLPISLVQWCCLGNRLYNSYSPPWGVVSHIGVGPRPTPICKTTTCTLMKMLKDRYKLDS